MNLDPKTLPDENKVSMWFRTPRFRNRKSIVDLWPPELRPYWDWCSKNITGKFDCTVMDDDGKVTWLFEKSEDLTFFLLRWK